MSRPAPFDTLAEEITEMIYDCSSDDLMHYINGPPDVQVQFCQHQEIICYGILKREVGEVVLPVAVALYHAMKALPKFQAAHGDKFTSNVIDFCDEHLQNAVYAHVGPDDITLEMTLSITTFNMSAQRVAENMAQEMLDHTRKECTSSRDGTPYNPPVKFKDTEYQRLVRSIYIYELAGKVLPIHVLPDDGTEDTTAWRYFWSQFAPWEISCLRAIERSIERIMKHKGMKTNLP